MLSNLARPQRITNRAGKWPSLKHGSPKLVLKKPLTVLLQSYNTCYYREISVTDISWSCNSSGVLNCGKLWLTAPSILRLGHPYHNKMAASLIIYLPHLQFQSLVLGAGRQGEPLFPCGGLPGRVRLGAGTGPKGPSQNVCHLTTPASLVLNEPSVHGEGSGSR